MTSGHIIPLRFLRTLFHSLSASLHFATLTRCSELPFAFAQTFIHQSVPALTHSSSSSVSLRHLLVTHMHTFPILSPFISRFSSRYPPTPHPPPHLLSTPRTIPHPTRTHLRHSCPGNTSEALNKHPGGRRGGGGGGRKRQECEVCGKEMGASGGLDEQNGFEKRFYVLTSSLAIRKPAEMIICIHPFLDQGCAKDGPGSTSSPGSSLMCQCCHFLPKIDS